MDFRQIAFVFVCICLHTPLVAQDCSYVLQGNVLDFHDKSALAGATVLVRETGNAVLSDLDGAYRIPGLCAGSYVLEVSHPECRTTLYPVRLDADQHLNLLLEHHVEELEEVRVIGQAYTDKTVSAREVILEQDQLERYSTASLGDALRELNGVSTLNTGATLVKPVIHGLTGSRVLILNDGVRMQDMEWGDEHAPNIDINSAGSVRLIKGAAALQYGGDAIGGVVVLEPEPLRAQDTLFGHTLVGGALNGRGGKISTALTKSFRNGWFLRGQASHKRLGDQQAPDYILSNTGIRESAGFLEVGRNAFESGFSLKYALYDAEIAILRASHIGNVDDLIRSINTGEPEIIRPFTYALDNPRQEVTHHLGRFKYYRRFEGLGKWQVQYDFQNNRRFEYDIRVGDDREKAAIDLELTTHTLSTDFNWDARRNVGLRMGLLGRYQNNFANPETGVRRLIPDYRKYDLGVFWLGEFRLDDAWSVDSGLRYDFNRMDAQKFYQTSRWEERGYQDDFDDFIRDDLGTQLLTNPEFDYHNFSFSTGAKYQWDARNAFRLNYTISQRAPNPSELFSDGLHHSAARIELGDLRIDSETSHKISASLSRHFKGWGMTLEPYAHYIQDFILLEPTGVEFTIRGAFPVWEYRQTDARLLGLDASAYISWSDFFRSEHGFSLVKGQDTRTQKALINIPPADLWHQLVFNRSDWKNLEISLRSDLVFRQNEYPSNITVFSPQQQQDVLLEINTPPNAYYLLGLHTSAEFPLGRVGRLTTGISVNNVLNTTYRDYLNRQRFFAEDLGRNINLQLKFNY